MAFSIPPQTVKTLTKATLLIIGGGLLLTAALVAPNAIQALHPFLHKRKRPKERIRQALHGLHRRNLIAYTERDNKEYVHLTREGKQLFRQCQMEGFQLPKRLWDGKWRLVFFDIPESKGNARRAFRTRLQTIGCYPLQKSILVYPHECRDEIHFVSSFFSVKPFVYYVETENLGRAEARARKFFNLS